MWGGIVRNPSDSPRRNAQREARTAQARAEAEAQRRKAEFLGARVPRDLRDAVLRRAKAEGLPVSIWIRKQLEAAVGRLDPAFGEAAPRGTAVGAFPVSRSFADVLGWETITLNRVAACASCSTEIAPGTSVTVGLSGSGAGPVVLCDRCKEHI